MSKAKIIDKKSVDSVLGEKNLLSQLHHPFIVNMVYSFQDHDYLYLVMDLLPGGNLRYHISLKRHFNEKQNRFLIGCILVGLEYIHSEKILHRDIKPENLVFDNNGYLRITDFGIAKKYIVNNKKDTSGTVGYLAPEVLCNENHNYSIDYYAVGIIAFELAFGHRPYLGKTKHEVKQLILTKQAHLDFEDLPDGYQNEAADFINKLIQRKPKNRLGKDTINEVINHPWLRGLDWAKIKNKSLKAYYIPKEGDNYDKKYCLQNNKIGEETIERYKQIINDPNYEIIFKNFDCEKIPDELKIIYDNNIIGDTLNANFSSNNSTTSISKNNKINASINDNNKKIKNNSLERQRNRNKSMENIFSKQIKDEEIKLSSDKINENDIKYLNKQKSVINIIDKKQNIINDDKDKLQKKENNNEINNENDKENISNNYSNDFKNKKIIFNKKHENNITKFSFRKKYNYNENNELKDRNKNINSNHHINPSVSNIFKEKNSLLENFGDISNIEKNKINKHENKDKNIEKDKEVLISKNNSQKMTNLNQYISSMSQKNMKNNNKFLSSSNSSINILQNELFANAKGNYFKKLLNKESHKIKNKNNNSLYASSSTKSLFKNNSIKNLSNSKKNFLKKELFNGTFYPNNVGSTKFFVINSNNNYKRRKSSASLINKNNDNINNQKLTSSSSMSNLKLNKNENREISQLEKFSVLDLENSQNINKKHVEKKLPFINIGLDKKKVGIFRNNLYFVKRNNSKNYLNNNGFFSERLKFNDNKNLKISINSKIKK